MSRWFGRIAGLVLLMLASCATQETRSPEALIQEFRGETKEAWRGGAQLVDAYGKVLDSLMPGLSGEKETDRQQAEQTLEDLSVRAGRPGAEGNRAALSKAMAARLGVSTPPPARLWLLRQLARIGGRESVASLAATLADADPKVRDAARRALERNPDSSAGAALQTELGHALNLTLREPPNGIATPAPGIRDAAWAIALINSLGVRRERIVEAMLVASALEGDAPVSSAAGAGGAGSTENIVADEPVACAAVAALGELGAVEAVERIAARKASPPHSTLFGRIAEARLRCAEHLLARRKVAEAAAVYRRVYDGAERVDVRVAALSGLAKAQGEAALPFLLERMNDEEARVRVAAAASAVELPGEGVTKTLANHLSSLPTDAQVRLIDGLSQRGGAAARLAVLGALANPSTEVRIAATRALSRVGLAAHMRLLARLAAERTGEEQKAARQSLATLGDPSCDSAIRFILTDSPPAIQAEALRAMKSRQIRDADAVELALRFAVCDEPSVRLGAVDYLADVADESKTEIMASAILLYSEEAEFRRHLEDAVVASLLRLPAERRMNFALRGLETGNPKSAPFLLSILVRIGDPACLATIRKYADANEAALRDAAVRSLCDWKDAAALPDVQRLMKTSANPTHRTLAVRAYVRLVRLPDAKRTPQQTLAMYDEALALAKSPDEKKLIFSGMGDLTCVEALDRLETAISDAAVQAEAAVALCSVARNVCGGSPARARAAVDRARGLPASDAVNRAADEATKHLDRYQGYITTWKYCGPYSVPGKDAGDLFDIPAGPEPGFNAATASTPSLATVEWRELAVTDEKSPWLFDLNQAASGSNCCVYLRTTITCPQQTSAKLEIGSDDCVKVWLNGQLVHANKVYRPLGEAADTVNVTLTAGANELLLKVVQGSGGWGACCGVKATDGGNIEALTISAR